MRKTALALVCLLSSLSFATEARADGFLGFDALYLDARGHVWFDSNVRDAAGYPVGATAEIQLDLVHQLELYGYTGFLYGLAGDVTTFHIPFMGGVLYNFGQGSKGVTVGGGFGALISYADVGTDTTNFDAGLEFHGGYQTSSLRFRAGLQFFQVDELSDSATAFVSVGFNLK
ncbi:MAG: hypothetical protein KJO07_08500 [Deltaproteobacteria bacterium]|jgi:hypothetical protein|nr:hypothetical protein [Deltaproteobacteria bacterium]